MEPTHDPIDKILEALQERAKELNCLYQVDERLTQLDAEPDEVFRGLLQVIPPGYQYPGVCQARITWEETVFVPPNFVETPWVQAAPIIVDSRTVGKVEAFYTQSMPRADEGPFLRQERKLIDTIAERVSHHLMQRQLKHVLKHRQSTSQSVVESRTQNWWAIVEFLRYADSHLLIRLSRKMLNHLCWNGVEEAKQLLQRFAPESDAQVVLSEDNRPVEKKSLQELLGLAEEAFRTATAHLSEDEIVSRIQKWIKDDKSAFLLETLENPAATVADIAGALQRHRYVGIEEREMTRPLQMALHVALVRRFFTEDLGFVNTAKNYVQVRDFYDLAQRIISPPSSHGKLGGKSSGLFLASQIIRKSSEYAEVLTDIRVPKTWYIASDGLLNFMHYNHLEDVYGRRYLELDQIRREYPHIVQVFKNSHLSPEIAKGLSMALDDFEERPLIVRSSSLLEDRMGSAFSGKYKSLFLANRGSKRERLAALQDAISEVYASIFGPDPIEYRAERGLLDLDEEMGILIQEVVGTQIGDYFLPAFSGVAFSHNEFRWSTRIKREDGLLRMVPGLGTRAVDRLVDDYPVLIAPGQPGLRINVTPEEIERYSPKMLDLINLRTRAFESVEVRSFLREHGRKLPMVGEMVSVFQEEGIRRTLPVQMDFEHDQMAITFDGLVAKTPFVVQMRGLLKLLYDKLGAPVDIEFAHDGKNLYLLQCRSQSYGPDSTSATLPVDPQRDRVLFTANRFVSNGQVHDITHVVYVDPRGYQAIGELSELKDIGRAIGRLNKLLPRRQFILMGPGRWGSRGDVKLGVSVTYSDISNTGMLIEIARKEGNYVPDLSFGTHFFQDLVEASIRYLPLYPDEPDIVFNERFLNESPNILSDLLPEYAPLSRVLRVIDIPGTTGGLILKVYLNADQDRAVGLLAAPASADRMGELRKEPETAQETHWRWRVRMAERIAGSLDARRFGVKALYLFGSAQNATAGTASDIDLLVHFEGDAEQRRALDSWFEGWSLCLAEMNYQRTGYRGQKLLDVHYLSDEEIVRQAGLAVKIGAPTDGARPLRLKGIGL